MNLQMTRAPAPPRRLARAVLGLVLLAISCQTVPSPGPVPRPHPVTIVVDFGGYPSADSAGRDEAHVDWTDDDPSDDVVCTSCFAACELQHYLRVATKDHAGFSIADDDSLPAGDLILVGGPDVNRATARLARTLRIDAADLAARAPEGYIIKTGRQGNRTILVLAGGARVGTLYAAYDFLHRIGVRWFAPGRLNEEVPELGWQQVPRFSVAEFPRFATRGFHAWENRGDEDFLVWMARNRLNYWCVEQRQRALLHKLGIKLVAGGHGLTARYLDPRAPYPYAYPRFPTGANLPPDPYAASPQFQGDADGDGRLSYFEAHPEWYAQRGGKRSSNIVGDSGDNFCTSNEDAMTEWMKNAIHDLSVGEYREADIVNAWLLDGGRWCRCARCCALGSATDRNLLFVNRFDREIKKARAAGLIRRPIKLYFLAYGDLAAPPTRPVPEGFDYSTCIATFYPIGRCYAHRFDDPACDVNARYDSFLRGWTTNPARRYRGRVCMGEYYNVSGYKSLPVCLMHAMQHEIPYYASLGIRDFHYMHCSTRNWGNKALTKWQMARQLWNPDTDCWALWKDYFAGRYGAAAPSMRLFYVGLEAMLADVTELKYGLARRMDQGIDPLFVNDHLSYAGATHSLQHSLRCAADCRRILDDLPLAELPSRIRARIAEDNRLFTYGERTLQLYDAVCRGFAELRARNREGAEHALADARALEGALLADTTSTRFSSSHANSENALSASYASNAVDRLALEIRSAQATAVKTFDPGRQPLLLRLSDWTGGAVDSTGGAEQDLLARLLDLDDAPHRRALANDRLTISFSYPTPLGPDLHLRWTGRKHPRTPHGTVRGAVLVNGYLVVAGDVPLAEEDASAADILVPARLLNRGVNEIEIRNLEPDSARADSPWLEVERMEVTDARSAGPARDFVCRGPQDLALSYRSRVDGSEQPFRVYLPSAYDGKTRLPALVALHGTIGSENSFFDDRQYGNGNMIREAEKRGIVVVCPNGRGLTEYRGVGEVDVLQVLDQVERGLSVDPDRISLSGHSMGGTGTTYLATRHPDLFAAGAPQASSYDHVNLLENLRHVPMLYVQGAEDWPIYATEGPIPIAARLRQLDYACDLWIIPGVKHNTLYRSAPRIMDWALERRRTPSPTRITFKTYFPHQGRAYWAEIREIARPGYLAEIDARIVSRRTIVVRESNLERLDLRPAAAPLDLGRPISVEIGGRVVFSGLCGDSDAVVCVSSGGAWKARREPAEPRPAVPYHEHLVGRAIAPPTQDGDVETSMGDWMAEMMRSISGADIAIYNRRDYRGVRLGLGRAVYTEDLFDWIRPYDRRLCTFRCTGRDLLEILEANVLNRAADRDYLVQVAGCRYGFDRTRPLGHRIVESTIDPDRTYAVACEGQVLSRETVRLAGRFGKIPFQELEPSAVSGAWWYIHRCGGELKAGRDGRVRDLTPVPA